MKDDGSKRLAPPLPRKVFVLPPFSNHSCSSFSFYSVTGTVRSSLVFSLCSKQHLQCLMKGTVVEFRESVPCSQNAQRVEGVCCVTKQTEVMVLKDSLGI